MRVGKTNEFKQITNVSTIEQKHTHSDMRNALYLSLTEKKTNAQTDEKTTTGFVVCGWLRC